MITQSRLARLMDILHIRYAERRRRVQVVEPPGSPPVAMVRNPAESVGQHSAMHRHPCIVQIILCKSFVDSAFGITPPRVADPSETAVRLSTHVPVHNGIPNRFELGQIEVPA